MSTHFQRDLDLMQRDVTEMAARIEMAVQLTIQALQERRPQLAEEVIRGDDAIDLEENRLEEECLKMLALHQPVAVDLRHIIAVLKINNELERMGDLAANIAERVLTLALLAPAPFPERLKKMGEIAVTMVHQGLDSFVKLDVVAARQVIEMDDEADQCNKEIIDELMQTMRQAPELVEQCLSLFSVVRHLERIADHATNVAEDVVYLIEGEIIRHKSTSSQSWKVARGA